MNPDIARYVTDPHGDVYAIQGLPEEVLAVVFAYVSRSPRGFRQNLQAVTRERAERFHEKWVLQYGHASVAEHAVVHLGVERISRYASAVLEDSRLISVTEYSQRYQEPQPESVHFPAELEGTAWAAPVRRFLAETYALYRKTLDGLAESGAASFPRGPEEDEEAYGKRLRRQAFEDARYALPLATTTSLGLTANVRELEHVVSKLLSHRAREIALLGQRMREAAAAVAPTLMRHAAPLPYHQGVRERAETEATALGEGGAGGAVPAGERASGPPVELVEFTGRDARPRARETAAEAVEAEALRRVLAALLLPAATAAPEREAAALAASSVADLARQALRVLGRPGPHDTLPRALEVVHYTFDVRLSEAAWHQLLRHRMMCSLPAEPRAHRGMTIPPRVREAGLAEELERAGAAAAELAARLESEAPAAAPYVVLNAHHRWVRLSMNLRQLGHLTRLRTSPQTQWDVRAVATALREEARRVHPTLLAACGAPHDP